MASIVFPTAPAEGQTLTHNGKNLTFTGGRWKVAAQFTAGSGGGSGGGVDEVAVNSLINTAITALNLGNLATADMFVSSSAPDNTVGKDGDLWAQTA